MANDFKKAFKGVDVAIKQGTARALNRALSSAKTKMVRALREETGLKTDVINSRIRSKNATSANLVARFGIATKFAIALSKFTPLIKNVTALYRDGSKRRRKGVTASVGQAGRQLVPGAFVLDNSGGLAVVGRKAAYDSSGNYVDSKTQSGLVKITTTLFSDVAEKHADDVQQSMVDTFDDIVSHEIDYAIQSKFDSNK